MTDREFARWQTGGVRALVIQHAVGEGPHAIADGLARVGVEIVVVGVHLGQRLPADLSGFAALIVMGGPMSARADAGFASMNEELRLIRDALDRDLPLLGICLGAQLLARALGASVLRGVSEIGWGPIALGSVAAEDPLFTGVDTCPALHWHGDTFDLPVGAVHLAATQQCAQQAFRYGETAWGLQFHLEVDQFAVEEFVRQLCTDEAQAVEILGAAPVALAELARVRDMVFDRFAVTVLARASSAGSQLPN